MSIERNQEVQNAIRRQQIWDLYTEGKSQREIAAVVGVTQQAVSSMLRRITTDMQDDLLDTVVNRKIQQSARLEYLYQQAVQAWEKSKGDKTKRKRKWKAGQPGATAAEEQNEVSLEGQAGDPRFLEAAREVLGDVRKLWGLDAPMKSLALVANVDLSKLTDDELQFARLLAVKIHGEDDDDTIDVAGRSENPDAIGE